MSTVSYNRVVNVNISVSNRFPTVANFSIPILFTEDVAATAIATDVVKAFGSLEEMLAYGFLDTDLVYLAAQQMLATPNAPRTFKVGLLDKADIVGSLTNAEAMDTVWYTAVIVPAMVPADAPALIAANAFLLDNDRILFFESEDNTLRDDGTDLTGVGGLLKAVTPSRMMGFYSVTADADKRYAAKAASYVSAVNYDNANSHYTLKFKELTGAAPSDLNDLQAQNLTGFLPGTGFDPLVGGFLNAYVCTAGLNYVTEGMMTDGEFLDLITFSDWLKVTMQRNVLSVFTNNRVVPYSPTGQSMLFGAAVQTLEQALVAGALSTDRLDTVGNVLAPYTVAQGDIAAQSPALVAQRIAPNMEYCARYEGAIHYIDIIGKILVAN